MVDSIKGEEISDNEERSFCTEAQIMKGTMAFLTSFHTMTGDHQSIHIVDTH